MLKLIAILLLFVSAWKQDETVSAYAVPDAVYVLQSIDGVPFIARATIRFDSPGKVSGTGPCNRFFANQIVPYPWFELGPIGATRRACPDLDAEHAYFTALDAMTLAEVLGGTLILSNDTGRAMVFQAE